MATTWCWKYFSEGFRRKGFDVVLPWHQHVDQAFCAGGDVRALYEMGRDPKTRCDVKQFFEEEYRLNYIIGTSAVPVRLFTRISSAYFVFSRWFLF